MTKRERILGALSGEVTDRIPYSLWPHYPLLDLEAKTLAEAQVRDALNYEFDFIKLMSPGLYIALDLGVQYRSQEGKPYYDKYGTLHVKEPVIINPTQLDQIPRPDVTRGHMGTQLDVVRNIHRLCEQVDGGMPVLLTVYSPLTTLYKLCGDSLLLWIEDEPTLVKNALVSIRDTEIKLVKEALRLGIAGVFFASQLCNKKMMSEDQYRRWGVPYDLDLLSILEGQTWFNVTHIHGEEAMWSILKDYPTEALNWHDRWVGPSLSEARKFSDKCFIGGIDEEHALGVLDPLALRNHVKEGLKDGGKCKFIIGPGCTVYPSTDETSYRVVKETVQNTGV